MPRAVNWIGRIPDQTGALSIREGADHAEALTCHLRNCCGHERADRSSRTERYRGPARRCLAVDENAGIAIDQRPAFREYVIRERVPNYSIPDRIIVGGVLPETGVTYYDVPQSFGATPYRYTLVNSRTVLVEPRTRRIVQIID